MADTAQVPQPPVFAAAGRLAAPWRNALPAGTLPVGLGLALLGSASYGYLAVAARSLSAAQFARLGLVWALVFTVGPGLFLPLEQELGRRLAAARSRGVLWAVVRRSAVAGGALAAVVALATLAVGPALDRRLFGGDVAVLVALAAASIALAPVHLVRGMLAGVGRFGRYGLQLALDGGLRVAGAGLLAWLAVSSAGPYVWILAAAPLCAVAVSLGRLPWPSATATEQREFAVSWRVLLRGTGWLLAGSFAAQALINGSVVAVKVLAGSGDEIAARFVTALVLARAPLFLFAALQAALLPGLARLVATGEFAEAHRRVRRLVLVLAAVGALTALLLAVAGPGLAQMLFGPGYRLPRWPLVVLSAGCTLFMIAAALTQLLLAAHQASIVALVWGCGAVAFLLALPMPGQVPMRASLALLVGAALSALLGYVALGSTRQGVPCERA